MLNFRNPAIIEEESKVKARDAMRHLKTLFGEKCHIQVAAALNLKSSVVQRWFHAGGYPSRVLYPKFMKHYESVVNISNCDQQKITPDQTCDSCSGAIKCFMEDTHVL